MAKGGGTKQTAPPPPEKCKVPGHLTDSRVFPPGTPCPGQGPGWGAGCWDTSTTGLAREGGEEGDGMLSEARGMIGGQDQGALVLITIGGVWIIAQREEEHWT